MFKKAFVVAIALILIIPICFAANIDKPATSPPNSQATSDKKIVGVFLEVPSTYVNNEGIKQNTQKKAEELFPVNAFTVLPLDTVIAAAATYRENNDMTPEQAFNHKDIREIATGLNCNYILRITMTNSSPRVEIEFPAVSSISDVTCDISLLDVNSDKYLVALAIINKGKKSATFDRNVSFEAAYDTTLDKAFKALEPDVKTL